MLVIACRFLPLMLRCFCSFCSVVGVAIGDGYLSSGDCVHRISDGQLFLSDFFFFFFLVLLLNGVGLETSQGNLSSSKS